MPKELVYSDALPFDEGPARSVVEVSWSREAEHVQLATKCIHMSDETTYHLNQNFPEATTSSNPPALTAEDGWYIQLDRVAINKLIRHLRRARDQAFGRDE